MKFSTRLGLLLATALVVITNPAEAKTLSQILNKPTHGEKEQDSSRLSHADLDKEINDFIDANEIITPNVRQAEDPDDDVGYIKLREPFTSTDTYDYVDAFFMGLQLDEFFDFDQECYEAIIFTIDDRNYYYNNKTLNAIDRRSSSPEEFWIHPFLNFTGILAGSFSEIIPECYQFGLSAVEYEQNRWERMDRSWSNFFLAFLFNQMGNALNFQQKFENIRLAKEQQNYQAVWLEYGDLLHIIYDFEPLEDMALEDVDMFVQNWVTKHDYLNGGDEQKSQNMVQGLTTLTKLVLEADDTLTEKITKKWMADRQKEIMLGQQPETNEDWSNLWYGFTNGVFEVFPVDSLPRLCKDNSTTFWQEYQNVFLRDTYGREDDVEFTYAIQELLRFPYGFTFSCYFASNAVFFETGYPSSGPLTDEEQLAKSVVFISDIPSNVLFNMGYQYNDILQLTKLEESDPDYWRKLGYYVGDFTIRLFWRQLVFTNFEY